MAIVLRGKHKGKKVTLKQWCNDWFITDEFPTKPFLASSLWLTKTEFIAVSASNSGIMFKAFQVIPYQNGYKLVRKKRSFLTNSRKTSNLT